MKIVKLSNGLRIIAIKLPFQSIGISVTYNFGSKDENQGERGIAHLIEHLLFRRSGGIKVVEYLNKLGSEFNGMTSFDFTTYYEIVPVEKLNSALELEKSRMNDLQIINEDLELEKQIVCREIDMRGSDPLESLLNYSYKIAWVDHPYRFFVEGLKKDVMNANVETILNLYKKGYSPENAVLTLAGNLEEDKLINVAKSTFEGLESRGKIEINQKSFEPTFNKSVSNIIAEKGNSAVISFYVPSVLESIKPIILSYLLSSRAGRLQKLIDHRVIGGFSIEYNPSVYNNLLSIMFFGYKNREKAINAILNEIKRPLDDEEIEKLKSRAKVDMAIQYNTLNVIFYSGFQQLLFNDPMYLFNKIYDEKEYNDMNKFIEEITSKYILVAYE